MKLRNRVAILIAFVLVVASSLVLVQAQQAQAAPLNGTADNVTSTSITIGNKTLVIDGNTEIVGDLVAGSTVQITANVQDDGTLLATKIQVKNDNSDEQNNDDEQDGDNENSDNGNSGQLNQNGENQSGNED